MSPEVIGTHGAKVIFEIRGVLEVAQALRRLGKDIKAGVDAECFRQSVFIENEVKESIAGNRPEPKSVDTGRFINSVTTKKNTDAEYSVYSDIEYAKFLEFGTSKMDARAHFSNTIDRNKVQIREAIQSAIKKETDKVE
jgi:HK97 gp10 family phage protein